MFHSMKGPVRFDLLNAALAEWRLNDQPGRSIISSSAPTESYAEASSTLGSASVSKHERVAFMYRANKAEAIEL